MNRILGLTLVLCAFMASGSGLAAADMYTYVVVLHDRVAAGEAPEPQIAAPDGEVLHRSENQRVVRVTAPAARALAEHPEVRYIQRVQVAGQVPPLLHSVGGAAPAMAANDWAPPTWASGDYVYDGEGNIIAIGTTTSPASDGGTESYAYDSAGRLVSASIAHGTTQSEQYTYDSFGNLVATTRTAGPSTATPASLATNRLTNATYDDAGNVTANESGTTEYQYDSFNMLRAKTTSTSTALYVYTADDERVGVYENSEQRWMIRDLSGKVLREWRDAGLVWLWREDYVYRNGSLAAAEREPAEGGTRHYHLDHLGTPRLITDPASMKISVHDYFPFGVEKTDFRQEMLERGTKWPEDMKFTGHERDFSGGITSNNRNQLDYMHARYYAPVWGRFLSVDPILGNTGLPQSWNRYSYALNNPMGMADPTGMKPCKVAVSGADAEAHGVPEGTEVDAECFEYDADGKGRESNTSPIPDTPTLFTTFGMDGADRWFNNHIARPVDTLYAKAGLLAGGPFAPKTLGECRAQGGCQTLTEAADMFGPMVGGSVKLPPLSGYTKHAINQAISRDGTGVAVRAIVDALQNPVQIKAMSDGTTRIVGRDATIVVNELLRAVTVWSRSSGAWRIVP